MSDFIDKLSVSDEERQKLKSLGASSPIGILSIRKASTEAFDKHFGPERADAIAAQLKSLLTEQELGRLNEPMRKGGPLGARQSPSPAPNKPDGEH
jgi:hypothetical protein